MKLALASAGALAALGLVVGPSFAGTTIVKNNTSQQKIKSYGNTFVSGSGMNGLTAQFTFVGGGMETLVFSGSGGTGGVTDATKGLSLKVSGSDTRLNAPFVLSSNTAIASILLDGFPGKTIFDSSNPNPGTAGSVGRNFTVVSGGAPYNITATYLGETSLGAAAPLGDIYRYLNIDFGATGFTGSGKSALTFYQDTDNVTPAAVPEASTMTSLSLLIALGVGSLLIASRRKKAASAL